jgi:hypothetical protein
LFSLITGLPAHAGPDTVLSYIFIAPIVLGLAYMIFLVWRENRHPRDGVAAVTERSDQNDDEERPT